MTNKEIEKELADLRTKLEQYRDLFKLIINQHDQTLEYSTAELKHYYCVIEGIEEKNFKPFLIYSDPPAEYFTKNININAHKEYAAGVSAEPCLVKLTTDGKPDLSDWVAAKPYIVQVDEQGNPILKTNLTEGDKK